MKSYPVRAALLCSLLLLWSSFVQAVRPQPPTGKVLLLSDIHFDPLADEAIVPDLVNHDISGWETILASSESFKKGVYPTRGKSDTNYTLFHSAMSAAAHQEPFDFVIVSGDYLRHNFVNAFANERQPQGEFPEFATKTALFVLETIQTTFNVPVYFALGNEDSACNDYGVAAGGMFLKALAGSLRVLADNPEAAADFSAGGFYDLPHPTLLNVEIIVLNSILWSPLYFNCQSDGSDPGSAEIKWLSAKLYQAKSSARKVILVMHIPPGLDAYKCSKGAKSKSTTSFWRDVYLSQFAGLMQSYGDIVQIALAGHTHMDDFRILTTSEPSRSVAFRITPSISPLFGNNPAFSVLHYSPSTGEISDTTQYYLDLGGSPATVQWTFEYRFPSVYGYNALTPSNFEALAVSIRNDPTVRQTFSGYYAASAPSPLSTNAWPFYSCAQTLFTASDYSSCIESQEAVSCKTDK
jgi:predicted phosphodiesterase